MAIGLVAFDLDGTLVRDKTCVEAIASAIGREKECAAFERLRMRDIAGVTAAREAMAEWYRDYSDEELVAGLPDLALAPGTEEAFALLREQGVATAIVSITWGLAVDWFATRLGADHALGTRLTSAGIEHVWPAHKGPWLVDLRGHLGLALHEVAAVGDSDGDTELLEAAGLRFFVGDRAPAIPGLIHLQRANLLGIAHRIVAAE